MRLPRLLAITPPSGVIDPGLVDAWLRGGGDELAIAVLLREPGTTLAELLGSSRLAGLRERAALRSVPMLASVAAAELDDERVLEQLLHAEPPIAGVQLRGDPSPDARARARARLPGRFIARSVHGLAPADAWTSPLDLTVVAPIFPPGTAQPGVVKQAIGLAGLRSWCRDPNQKLLALGGIDPRNAEDVLRAGAWGVAGISLVFAGLRAAEDNVAALRRVFAALRERDVPPTS